MNKVGVYSSPPCIPVLAFFDKLHFDHADDDDTDIDEVKMNGDVAYLGTISSNVHFHLIDIDLKKLQC